MLVKNILHFLWFLSFWILCCFIILSLNFTEAEPMPCFVPQRFWPAILTSPGFTSCLTVHQALWTLGLNLTGSNEPILLLLEYCEMVLSSWIPFSMQQQSLSLPDRSYWGKTRGRNNGHRRTGKTITELLYNAQSNKDLTEKET